VSPKTPKLRVKKRSAAELTELSLVHDDAPLAEERDDNEMGMNESTRVTRSVSRMLPTPKTAEKQRGRCLNVSQVTQVSNHQTDSINPLEAVQDEDEDEEFILREGDDDEDEDQDEGQDEFRDDEADCDVREAPSGTKRINWRRN
jgi:hypothetical protein